MERNQNPVAPPPHCLHDDEGQPVPDQQNSPGQRSDDVAAVQHHLVNQSSRGPIVPVSKMFVQLKELVMDQNQDLQWRESGWWTGSEDQETAHIVPMSVHSLLVLQKLLSHGVVLLDLQQSSLGGVAQQVVERLLDGQQVSAGDGDKLLRTLLLPHSDHQDPRWFSRNISAADLSSLIGRRTGQSELSRNTANHREADVSRKETSPSQPDGKLMERAEATVVLVGSVGFLDRPFLAFVRLQEAVLLDSVLEVSVPVRFLSVLLGPPTASLEYHQMGRCVSTLMSDRSFHEAASRAESQQDLLTAVDRFLERSVLLPPPGASGEELLPSPRFQGQT